MTRILAILKEPELSAVRFERLSERFAGVGVDVVGDLGRAETLIDRADVLVTIGPILGERAGVLFSKAAALKWVQSIGVGVDNILGHPALASTVAVTNVRGVHGAQMSEAALAAMLALARQMPRMLGNQAAARWERFAPRVLAGSTVGILGVGAIAAALAPRCKALEMTVVGFSSSPRPMPGFDRMEPCDALVSAVGDLDHLVLLTPYSTRTHHIVGAGVLAAMKRDAFLVNLARGGVLDEEALLWALDSGRIAGAALDVFSREPLPADSRLWSHPRIQVSPHLGGFHLGYPEQVFAAVADNLGRYLAGGTPALLNRMN
jgi:phosphoglycerate dehydrogenase-like enzyme